MVHGRERGPIAGAPTKMLAEAVGFPILRCAQNHALRLKPPRRNATDSPPGCPLHAFRPHRFESPHGPRTRTGPHRWGPDENAGGGGRIRTHGALRLNSFQDCSLQPLGHASIVCALARMKVYPTRDFENTPSYQLQTPPESKLHEFHGKNRSSFAKTPSD